MIKWLKSLIQRWNEYRLPIDPEYIRSKVEDAMVWSFQSYDFIDIIDDTELSTKETRWAKDHLTWGVEILE